MISIGNNHQRHRPGAESLCRRLGLDENLKLLMNQGVISNAERYLLKICRQLYRGRLLLSNPIRLLLFLISTIKTYICTAKTNIMNRQYLAHQNIFSIASLHIRGLFSYTFFPVKNPFYLTLLNNPFLTHSAPIIYKRAILLLVKPRFRALNNPGSISESRNREHKQCIFAKAAQFWCYKGVSCYRNGDLTSLIFKNLLFSINSRHFK